MAVAVQNVTGSCKPYRTAGFPNDDCRFAAWAAMVKSGLVDIAFLVDAHCGPVDIQRCQAYTRSMGDVATKGAPTTTQTSQRLVDPAEGLPAIRGIQSGGILTLINPALQSRIIHTTHRCSGRLFLVHLRHGTDDLVIVAPSVRSPITPEARSSAAPIPADDRPLVRPHIPLLPLPGFAGPLSPESRPFSATDAPPGVSPTRSRPQRVGDSNYSDIEDDDGDDGSASLSDATHAPAAMLATSRPYTNVVCGAPRDLVRVGRYHYTHRPYVGIDVLVAQIAERRAELAFLRSKWPRGSTQPIGAASDMAVATTAALTDPSSPDTIV